jgi:glycosyltransferase involved in cell wall biosynthesis
MGEGLVSIVLCTFNGRRFLEAQVESLLAQGHRRLEIIAVDDASSDGTRECLEAYAAADSRIVLRARKERRGLSAGIEEGLTHANGEYVALSDQDDIWERDKLTILLEEIGEGAAVYCASALIDEHDRPLGRTLLSALGPIEPRSGLDPWELFWQNSVSGHATLFRASLIPHILPLDPALMHDHQIGIVASARGGLRYCDRPLVRHRIHDDNYVNRLPEGRKKIDRDDVQKREHKIHRRERWRKRLVERADFYASRGLDPKFTVDHVDSLRDAQDRLHWKTFDVGLWWTLMRHRRLLLARDPRPLNRAFQGAKGRRWYDRGDLASFDPARPAGITRSEP